MGTKIEWTDESWNPVVGCTKVSEGCQNCYAERMAHRLKSMGNNNPQYLGKTDAYGNWTGKIECCDWLLDKPLHWRRPRRIFVCSMGDLFHPAVPFEFVCKVFETTWQAPQHTYLILTKRPKRIIAYKEWGRKQESHLIHERQPRPKQWLGISVENQKRAEERIPILLQIPAAKRFVSCEPLLGPINLLDLGGIMAMGGIYGTHLDWVIIGCESGPKRRPCDLDWIRSIVNQCKAANVPVFVKQLSINGKVSHDPKEWPEDLRIRQWPEVGL